MLESLLIPDQLHSHYLLCHVVKAFQCLAETAFAQEFNHFKAVAYVVF